MKVTCTFALYRDDPRYIFTKTIYQKDSVQTSQFCAYQLWWIRAPLLFSRNLHSPCCPLSLLSICLLFQPGHILGAQQRGEPTNCTAALPHSLQRYTNVRKRTEQKLTQDLFTSLIGQERCSSLTQLFCVYLHMQVSGRPPSPLVRPPVTARELSTGYLSPSHLQRGSGKTFSLNYLV